MDLPSLPSLATIPLDWIILSVFALVSIFDAYRSGSGRAAALAVALPVSIYLYPLLAKTAVLAAVIGGFKTPILHLIIFGILFALLFILVSRITYGYADASRQPAQALMAGIAATAVFAACWQMIPDIRTLWTFGPTVAGIFGESYRIFWIIGAYALLAFSRR